MSDEKYDFLSKVCPSPTFSPSEELDEDEVTWVWKRAHAGVEARKQPMSFDKIRERLQKLKKSIETFCNHKLHINIDEIAQHVVSKTFSGITTSELDEIAASFSGSRVKHPDYTHFAGCLRLSDLRANLRYLLQDNDISFLSYAKYAHGYIDDQGKNTPLISDRLYELSTKYGDQIDAVMKADRDFIFHDFGVRTLIKTPYLICRKESIRLHREVVKKNIPIETPQHMWMRVALGIWDDNLEEAFKVYEALSTGKSIFASPTLFSSGTSHPTLSSCFLLKMKGDDLGSIFDTVKDCSLISKNAGGIGLAISNIRSKGSFIGGTNGTSNGIKPMVRVLNNVARYVDQCFTPDTLVFSHQGLKRIDTIVPNDLVMNGDGNWDKVQQVQNAYYKGDMVKFSIKQSIFPVKVTPNHLLMVLRDQGNGANFDVVRKRLDRDIVKVDYVEAKDVSVRDMMVFPIPTYEQDIETFTGNDCRMIGIMIGDGWTHEIKNASCVYLNKIKKQKTADFVKQYLLEKGINFTETFNEVTNVLSVRWSRPNGFPITRNMLYDGNSEKIIHSNLLHLPAHKTWKLIEGILETDGCVGEQQGQEITLEMTSLNVVLGVRFMLLRMGILSSGYVRDRVGQSHKVRKTETITCQKPSYVLRVPRSPEVCEIFGIEYGKWFNYMRWNNMLFSRVTSKTIEHVTEDTQVIDLKMTDEKQPSYVTDCGHCHNGGSRRKGAFAMYLEPWHSDIDEFLQLKVPHGSEENRARDLFYALWCPDLFFERVSESFKTGKDVMWSLMDPKVCKDLDEVWGKDFTERYERFEREGKFVKQISIRTLWKNILEVQKSTGTPYILAKGNANKYSMQSHLGTIKSSNLCVSGQTPILTQNGYYNINELTGQNIRVWNGHEWSSTTVHQTSESSELLKLHFSDGGVIECTPYHKFYIQEVYGGKSKEVRACDLRDGDKLVKFELPEAKTFICNEEPKLKYPYTHGMFCADGTYNNNRPILSLYGEKKKLIGRLHVRTMSGNEDASGRLNTSLPLDMCEKFYVPINEPLSNKLEWFAGYCDGDGTISRNGENQQLQACSIHKEFLMDIRLMLQTMGIHSKITIGRPEDDRYLPDGKGGSALYHCKQIWRLLITSIDLHKLIQLGWSTSRLSVTEHCPKRNSRRFVNVTKIENNYGNGPTYCFNEPLRNKGVFNGYLTGQCVEIMEYTSEKEISVCNLSSIPIGNYVIDGKFDYQGLYDTTRLMIRSLNRVIDVTKYPVPEAEYSNMRHRPVGLGVSGVANAHFKLRIPFDSPEAIDFHHKFAETMYFAALTESNSLAVAQGAFPSIDENGGSKIRKGIFHWEQWQGKFKKENEWMNTKPHPDLKWDWEDLREKVKKDGVRNSLLIAYMPTASTGQICNMWEGAELPYTLPCARKTKAGEFTQWEREMVMDLIKSGLWKTVEDPVTYEKSIPMMNAIISNQGSIQITSSTPEDSKYYLEQIPDDIRKLYKGAFDVSGDTHRNLFRAKAPWIDQSMSFNVYFKTKDEMTIGMTRNLLRGWKMGLKTLSYYTRTLQQTDTVNVSAVKKQDAKTKKPRKMLVVNSGDVCVSCS